MSAKLVRRLLQQQLEPSAPAKKRKRVESALVDDETKRAFYLETNLGLGNLKSTRNSAGTKALQQIKAPKKKVLSSSRKSIGNSRASSSATLSKHQPTFDKRSHAKEQKNIMLSKIAKMLEQGKKTQKKSST